MYKPETYPLEIKFNASCNQNDPDETNIPFPVAQKSEKSSLLLPFVKVFFHHIEKIGLPFDDKGGVFVHTWSETENGKTGRVTLQNFKKTDDPKYYNGLSAIILNESENKAYLVHSGFWEY